MYCPTGALQFLSECMYSSGTINVIIAQHFLQSEHFDYFIMIVPDWASFLVQVLSKSSCTVYTYNELHVALIESFILLHN